ncbi:putative membrane protein [Paenibacillus turicensis]|uniref:Membrane protein n=1 Tax=Paenibacillus turicensis TaxID=160487 RepID=A0ABS4FUB8_9BACL|nr:DUF5808 domain-containing protein [Paenibacillus turicensis]MBP1906169.1 putative membrane protein [Paenibacillus turicensis]
MQLFILLPILFIIVPLVLMLSFIPYMTRETVSFGVTVSEFHYFSPTLRVLRRKYATYSLIGASVIILFCLYFVISQSEQSRSIISIIGVVVFTAYYITLNILFYYKMKLIKQSLPDQATTTQKIMIDTSFRQQKLTHSNYWFAIPFTIAIIMAVITLLNYDALPNVIPMKFDLQGNVTSSAPKTYLSVMGLSLVQLSTIGLMMFVNWSIKKSKQQLSVTNPTTFAVKNIKFRRRWSLFTIVTSFLLTFLFAMIQINMLVPHPLLLLMVSFTIPVLIILGALLISLLSRQGGGDLRNPKNEQERSQAQPVNDDVHWKLGYIYFNRNDPSFSIEKRNGIGWTLNFAHPLSWVILIGIIAFIIISSLLSK